MATDQENREGNLKHLGFFRVAAIRALACVSALYGQAKENSGPLRSGVEAVEGTVKMVVGPVYQRLKGVPDDLLCFVDKKVDETVTKLNVFVPPPVKQVSSEAYGAAQKVPQVAKSFVSKAHQDGVVVASKSFYTEYEPAAVEYMVKVYHALYSLPLFPHLAEVVIPTAAHWSEKYNRTVVHMTASHYPFCSYLPLVPIEKISKTFEGKKKKKESGEMEGITEISD
ncbi:stress-related protein-like [Nymphaea colorata]|nr:stress-related protein-like [Nymphaea colorata]